MPLLVTSANGRPGFDVAWAILERGGSPLDAVEAGVRAVEDDPDDHTVGFGGYPNLLGEVELDASVMEGAGRRAGAVGGLRGYRYAVTVARAVLERLPHVLVTGEGGIRLAEELGLPAERLLTDDAERVWRDGLKGRADPGSVAERMLSRVAMLATDPEQAAGTVNFIARSDDGRIASAVSTSGWAWKYPGRLGDSPVIGAGNYADDRYGAAACTGWGELAIRACTARSVVRSLQDGLLLEDACRLAIADIRELSDRPVMHLVAVDGHGGHAAASTAQGTTYLVRSGGMHAFEELPRLSA